MSGDVFPGELPLRIVDQPGGAVIRCLCGAEAATLRRAVTPTRAMRSAVQLNQLSPDVTPAAVLMMILHARKCPGALYSQLP
jgi:hypothetical protein